jgi:hypothetical protein
MFFKVSLFWLLGGEIHPVVELLLHQRCVLRTVRCVEQPAMTHVQPNAQDGSITVEWFRNDAPVLDGDGRPIRPAVGRLQVWFERADADDPSSPPSGISSVRLSLAEGLTPTVLQRFPWARMLAIADAGARAFGQQSWDLANKILDDAQANYDRAFSVGNRRRPGRRGHPEEFYKHIAARYMAHRRTGAHNPTALLAQEMNYSRSTVAGLIRTARRKGHLPPARPRRAG